MSSRSQDAAFGTPTLPVSLDAIMRAGCDTCPDTSHDCPSSQRSCGHHCNHSWSHDRCCWWTGARGVEGSGLLSRPVSNRRVGSNPTPSVGSISSERVPEAS